MLRIDEKIIPENLKTVFPIINIKFMLSPLKRQRYNFSHFRYNFIPEIHIDFIVFQIFFKLIIRYLVPVFEFPIFTTFNLNRVICKVHILILNSVLFANIVLIRGCTQIPLLEKIQA